MQRIAVKLKSAGERSIKQNHPWIYESSIELVKKPAKSGDLAFVFSRKSNKLLGIGLFDMEDIIRIRMIHFGSSVSIDQPFFKTKIENALKRRSDLDDGKTTAYRLVYGENDGLPGLIIDVYNDIAVMKLYSSCWFPYLDWLVDILKEVLKIKVGILRLNRKLNKLKSHSFKESQVLFGDLDNSEIIYHEHGLMFYADVLKGHKTGGFLDHRHNRLVVRELAKGKRVLDVFSYTGGFTVNALKGGALSVHSVDISENALNQLKKNAELNKLQGDLQLLSMDAFEALQKFEDEKQIFELIIIDPPSMAKSNTEIEGAIKSYLRLFRLALKILIPNGLLLMASCSSRINKEAFYEMLQTELKAQKKRFETLKTTTHDVDHPHGIAELDYLKSIYFKID